MGHLLSEGVFASDRLHSDFGNAQVLADFLCQIVVDLGMAGNGGACIQRGIVPPRVPTAFAKQFAAVAS